MAADPKKSSPVDFDIFRDLATNIEQFKMPSLDTNAFVEARRKDVEALVVASKITYDAMQAVTQTQSAMLTQAMQDLQEFNMVAMGGNTLGGDWTRHTEAVQKAWQRRLADMNVLSEMVQKAQIDAMAALTERANESVGEMKGMVHMK